MSDGLVLALCDGRGRAMPLGSGVIDAERKGEGKRAALAAAYGIPLWAVPYDVEEIDVPAFGRDSVAFPHAWRYGLVPRGTALKGADRLFFRLDNARVEGYWRIPGDRQYDHMPMPEPQVEPWHGKSAFLSALSTVERAIKPIHYMGTSECRVCGCDNGSGEFFDPRPEADHGWRWPSGFRHYVEAHNVEPSNAFLNFIVWRARNPLRASRGFDY